MSSSSLPDGLSHDDDDEIRDDEVVGRPDPIRLAADQRTVPRNEKSNRAAMPIALPIALLSLLVSVMVMTVAVDHPAQKIAAMFGGKKSAEATELGDINIKLEALTASVADASHKADQAVNGLRNVTQDIEGLRSQLSDVDSRVTNLENRVVHISSKLDAMAARPTPKPIAAKPKEPIKVPILVNVVSIRNQGGVPWTSLREGLDTSPLLTVGDEWRSFKVLGIDAAKRDVQVSSNGSVTNVRL